jgi:beta-lactamase superfamily II metal-dependent hydrolase
MTSYYVSKNTTPLYAESTGKKFKIELLWGDSVELIHGINSDERVKVRARARTGYVKKSDIGPDSLLEVYFIDVGQGDGILIRTPGNRHVLIDGGYKRSAQPTGKNAADFVDWKFAKDYGASKIELDVMIASHCDADHYGGLWDLLNPNESHELDLTEVKVNAFYHAGVSWWKKSDSGRDLGPVEDGYLTRLLEDRKSAIKALSQNRDVPKLQGFWSQFIQCVVNSEAKIQRLSSKSGYIPHFGPENGKASLKVLAPVEFLYNDKPALHSFGSKSKNTNGHSILLRLDYGRTRILLTGDLNTKSQQLLLDRYKGQRHDFACDVAKSCHHGSDDCSFEFLSTLQPSTTIISSGDNEGHGHPRPGIVAASALTGHTLIQNDEIVTPLIYSTEVARSYRIGKPYEVSCKNYPTPEGPLNIKLTKAHNPKVKYTETAAGDLRPRKRSRRLNRLYVVGGVIYGLVNVRTDGNKILCATLNEKDHTWDVKTFESRF